MRGRYQGIVFGVMATSALALTSGAWGQERPVTADRLLNPEPENWLQVHHDYHSSRFSTLDQINSGNIKDLKVAYLVAIGGDEPGGSNPYARHQGVPVVNDGAMYMVDGWSVVYKIDVSDGSGGRITWSMDPGIDKSAVWIPANRGVALHGDKVISITGDGRMLWSNRDTGEIVIDQKFALVPEDAFTAAPLVIGDVVILPGSGGDQGDRSWIAGVNANTGDTIWRTYAVPAPGEPGSETWKDGNNAWKTGGGAFWQTGSYDPELNLTYWGTGNPVPMFDAEYRPGDNLFTNSTLALDPATGKIAWYFQYTPNDQFDYDEIGSQLLVDTTVDGQNRKVLSHFGRNGFFYSLDRTNGSFVTAGQYVERLTWTAGIDPKTGKPVEYDPSRDVQQYAVAPRRGGGMVEACPNLTGGVNYFPTAYSPKTGLAYGAGVDGCFQVEPDESRHVPGAFNGGNTKYAVRNEGTISAMEPATGKVAARIHLPFQNRAGVMATAGGFIMTGQLDGKVQAYDDTTLDLLWTFSTGTPITAPPITFAVGGKQYIAIYAGGEDVKGGRNALSPELHELRQRSNLFVFTL